MKSSKLTLLLFSLILLTSCQLFIDPSIIDLTKQNFSSTTGLPLPNTTQPINATQNWFIIFYSPLCPHCVQTMPSWNNLSTSIKQTPSSSQPTKIAKADCIAHGDICKEFEITGYPTIILLLKTNEKKVYQGNRTVEGYQKFLEDVYAGIEPTDLVAAGEQSEAIKEIKFFFENLTWAGALMMVIMCVLIGMLIYVIFDKETDEGKQFTSVVAADKQVRQSSTSEL